MKLDNPEVIQSAFFPNHCEGSDPVVMNINSLQTWLNRLF
jgi:hypothetical protein